MQTTRLTGGYDLEGLSDRDNTHGLKNREAEDKHDADRCDVLDNNGEKALGLELVAAFLSLGNKSLGLEEIADKDAGDKCDYRHQNAVTDEIEEVKEAVANDLDSAQNTAI